MRKGVTENINAIIESISQMESIKSYILCGGTALSMQIGHRKSEDLDFMMWNGGNKNRLEIDWPNIERELINKFSKIESFNMLGFDQVEFVVKGVKLSFYISKNSSPIIEPIEYLGNIRLANILAIMSMKIEVMLRRMKFRDYYDIYSILKAGYQITDGINGALKYSKHKLSSKNIIAMLLSGNFIPDNNFKQLEPIYNISKEEIRDYILQKLKEDNLR